MKHPRKPYAHLLHRRALAAKPDRTMERFVFTALNGIPSWCRVRLYEPHGPGHRQKADGRGTGDLGGSPPKPSPIAASSATIVILSEPDVGSSGGSVTNKIENLATEVCLALHLDPDQVLLIEHYEVDDTADKTSAYDLVEMKRTSIHTSDEVLRTPWQSIRYGFFEDPEWRRLKIEEVQDLVLTGRLPAQGASSS